MPVGTGVDVMGTFAGMSFFNPEADSPDGSWVLDGERLTAFPSSLTSSQTP